MQEIFAVVGDDVVIGIIAVDKADFEMNKFSAEIRTFYIINESWY